MSSRSWVVQCLTVVVVVAMTSCSDTTIAPNPQAGSLRLSITPALLTLQEGETHPVQAVVTDRNGIAIPSLSSSVQWSSSAGDTVQVSGDIAHALLPGHAHVYAVLNAEGVSLSDSIPVTVTPVAASIQVVQGDAQRAPVNSTLATPLEVRVLDRHGAPVAGYMVRFAPSPSGGQVDPDSVATDANGDARTEWTLPATPGSYAVSVDAGSLQGSPASFTATALILQPASALHIQPDSVVLPAIQDTAHLSASVYGTDGQLINGWEPTWTSMDPSVASVDRHGTVQALGSGRVHVIAAVPGAADTTTIVVRQAVAYLQVTGARELPSVGDTLHLGVLLLDPNGFPITGGETVHWTSSAPSVATVDGNGLVTATGYGSTQITAAASFLTSRVLIPVSPTVAQVNITPGFYALSVGDTARLTASALDANGHAVSGAIYVWSSSDSAVARVGQTGLVTAIANGSATIRATSGSTDGEAAINVGGSTATVSRITISPASEALHAIGDTIRLTAVALDSAGGAISAPTIAWASLDPAIASVNGAGRVRSLAIGTARIRASDGAAADTAIITVDQVPASVSVSPASISLMQGDSAGFSASVLDAMGVAIAGASVSWSASNSAISVSSAGMVRAVSTGTATVTASSGNVNGSASVVVTGIQTTVKRVATTPSTMSLNALGDTATIQAVAYDSAGTPVAGAGVAWRSLNPGVVTVNASGRITANAVGLAFIVASSVCCTAAGTTSVAVSQVVKSVSVSPAQVSLAVGASQTLSAVAYDAGGSNVPGAAFTWSSSVPSVASVNSSGVVTAVGAGSATITATSGAAGGTAQVAVSSTPTDTTGSPSPVTWKGPGGPHEPSGMSQAFYMDGTTKNWGPKISLYGASWGSHVSVVTDPNAPNGKAVQVDFPAGQPEGFSGLAVIRDLGGPYRYLYIRTVFEFNPTWQQHPSGTTKLFYYGPGSQPNAFFPEMHGTSWVMHWTDQCNCATNIFAASDPTVAFPPGSYHTLEIYQVTDSAGSNGSMTMWLDGNKIRTWDDWHTGGLGNGIDLSQPLYDLTGGALLNAIQLGVYWGGSGGYTKTQNDWMRWGEIYISGKK